MINKLKKLFSLLAQGANYANAINSTGGNITAYELSKMGSV